jgi:hypothetical protein
MPKKNVEKSSQYRVLLYAVIWGVCAGVFLYSSAKGFAQEEQVSSVDEMIGSLGDPFDPRTRAPGLGQFFQQRLDRIKAEAEEVKAEAEALKRSKLPVVPLKKPDVPEPVVLKTVLPEIKVTGIVYGTDRPQAIINGAVVDEGDVLSNRVTVVRIRKGSVDVQFKDLRETIKFNDE